MCYNLGMKRIFLTILSIITVFAFVFGCKPEQNPPTPLSGAEVFKLAEERVVEVKCGNEVGTGFIVSAKDGYATAVTCYHVVDGAGEESVRPSGGEWISEVDFLAYDDAFDVAFLRFACDKEIELPSALRVREEGTPVYAVGNAMGEGSCITDGIVSVSEEIATVGVRALPVTRVTAALNPGMSGGMVLDEYGALVGMAVGRKTVHNDGFVDSVGYVLPAVIINALYGRLDGVGSDRAIVHSSITYGKDSATVEGKTFVLKNGVLSADGVASVNGTAIEKIGSIAELTAVAVGTQTVSIG